MNASKDGPIVKAYAAARDRYSEAGVDADAAMRTLRSIPISLHCWQGDDVGGFEAPDATLTGGGIQATGNYCLTDDVPTGMEWLDEVVKYEREVLCEREKDRGAGPVQLPVGA